MSVWMMCRSVFSGSVLPRPRSLTCVWSESASQVKHRICFYRLQMQNNEPSMHLFQLDNWMCFLHVASTTHPVFSQPFPFLFSQFFSFNFLSRLIKFFSFCFSALLLSFLSLSYVYCFFFSSQLLYFPSFSCLFLYFFFPFPCPFSFFFNLLSILSVFSSSFVIIFLQHFFLALCFISFCFPLYSL